MGWKERRIAECVFDLTTIACELDIFKDDIDSRYVFDEIYDIAKEFEEHYTWVERYVGDDGFDYLTAIENFGRERLNEFMKGVKCKYDE